jgi:DNA modification methylase
VVEANGNEIIAVRRRGLTDSQKKRLALFDNRAAELAEWDVAELDRLQKDMPEALEGMFQDGELETILEEGGIETVAGEADAEPQIDRAAELNKKWQVKAGDLWRIGEHRLLCGDSTKREDVERVMGGEKAQLMVTDPPYGVEYDPTWRADAGVNKNQAKMGKVQNDDVADWTPSWKLFEGDVVYVYHAGRMASTVQASLECAGFVIRAQIVWAKDRMALSRGDYHWQHEPVWYAVRDGKPALRTDDRTQTTLWTIPARDDAGHGHGTQKPLECMAKPIRNHTLDIIYDPFLGSGTTMVACENLKRKCRGIEISPDYCAVILERMQAAFPEIKIERA